MSDTTPSGDECTQVTTVLETSVVIDLPVSEVWTVFRDMRRWYTEYDFQVVDGPAYDPEIGICEGQVYRLKSSVPLPRTGEGDGESGPEEFTSQVLKVVPERETVTVITGSAYDFKRHTSFYVRRLFDDPAGTRVVIESYGEAELFHPLDRERLREFESDLAANWLRSWTTALTNLTTVLGQPS